MDAKFLALLKANLDAGMITQAQFEEFTGPKILRSNYKDKCSYTLESADGTTKLGPFMGAKAQVLLEVLGASTVVNRFRETVLRDAANDFKFTE